jgi:F0F1-type ATP synthase epsilon subunit
LSTCAEGDIGVLSGHAADANAPGIIAVFENNKVVSAFVAGGFAR